MSEYWPLLLLIGLPAVALATLLYAGLRRHRDAPVPWWWMGVATVAGAAPGLIALLGILFVRAPFGPPPPGSAPAGVLVGLLLLVQCVAVPALIGGTIVLGRRGSAGWKLSVVPIGLLLAPLTFFALLAAGQMLSGVSL